ncbi:MAG: ribosomal L7Ae/L30e/S12e/Gadd45 family protein [Bacillota bacterium]
MSHILNFIGLAKRAGKVAAGEVAVVATVQKKTTHLLIVSTDASKNTKKKFNNSAAYYHIPIVEFGDKEALGMAIGEEFRAVLSITDLGFATKLISMIEAETATNAES